MPQLSLVKSLSHLKEEQRFVDEVVLDHVGLTLTRGAIVEIVGDASVGKTSLALSLLAKLTGDGETCAVVDASHSFDAVTASQAGVALQDLLWIRCGNDVEKAFMSTDYLVQAKGFGAIWLNLAGLPEKKLRMVPKSYWFRYRTRLKETPTVLLVTAAGSLTGSASQQSFVISRKEARWSGSGKFKLLREFYVEMASRRDYFSSPVRTRIQMDYSEV
ncbi:MAG: hypothetical protein JO053_15010 [Acidobacteria bacterium]|nr:hypothetical protein [Acidobacteriota bacterium]